MTAWIDRRRWLRAGLASLTALTTAALVGCASGPSLDQKPPIVFVHGNGDSAALWQTTVWRFESNGWPRERMLALDMPYPLARDDDSRAQPGRSSTAESMAHLKAEVERFRASLGADKVILVGNSRGGNAIRNYIQNGGGAQVVSHAVLGGTPNHGVWSIKGFREANEFAGTGPFLTGLNAPKGPQGDEVTPGVRWMTIRSDNNDKFAQPDGLWIGAPGRPTGVTFAGPELKGATNVVIPGIDHRETSYSAKAFEATWRFITGRAPATTAIQPQARAVLDGRITGLGVNPLDATSGAAVNNLPVPGAVVQVFAINPQTGQRTGEPVHRKTVAADGRWGPFTAQGGQPYEFEVSAPGYATMHIYRSGFARSSDLVHMRLERLADADRQAGAVVTLARPRGYFDPVRDQIRVDGQTPPGIPANSGGTGGAGVAASKLRLPAAAQRTVVGEYNGERIVGQTWPASAQRLTVLEVTD